MHQKLESTTKRVVQHESSCIDDHDSEPSSECRQHLVLKRV